MKFFQSSIFLFGQTLIVAGILSGFGFVLAAAHALHWWTYLMLAALFVVVLRLLVKEQRQAILEITDEGLVGKLTEFPPFGEFEPTRQFRWAEVKAVCFSTKLRWEFSRPVFVSRSFWGRLNLFFVLNGSKTVYYVPTFHRIEEYPSVLDLLRSKTTVREIHALSELDAFVSSSSAAMASD